MLIVDLQIIENFSIKIFDFRSEERRVGKEFELQC